MTATLGLDPYSVVDQGEEDFLIKSVMVRKAADMQAEQRKDLAEIIAAGMGVSLMKRTL